MKNSKIFVAVIGIALIIAIGALGGRAANAAGPTTVGLGTATSYSVLAHTTVTNTGSTIVNRDLGIDAPASSVTGFPPGTIGGATHTGDAQAGQAKLDLTNAYLDAAGRASSATHGDLVGMTLVGGTYTLSSLASDLTGDVTLDGQSDPSSVWIFKSPATLITSSTSRVLLTNGASACNVFWQVGSSATLNSGSSFVGTILALTSISVTNGVTVNGRTLARNGAVTLDADTFTTPLCGAPGTTTLPPCEFMVNLPNAPCAGTRLTPVPASTTAPAPSAATVAPSAAAVATATPTGAGATPTGATATPTVAFTPAPVVAAVQTLPSTSTSDQLNPLLMLALALAGLGVLLLLRRPIRHF
jgi:type VI secretion system secreted protein VgrG